MARRMSTASYNKMLFSYHFFSTEAEARAYIAAHRWKKYTISSNASGDCWTVYHKER